MKFYSSTIGHVSDSVGVPNILLLSGIVVPFENVTLLYIMSPDSEFVSISKKKKFIIII